jgi:hypothetical protein
VNIERVHVALAKALAERRSASEFVDDGEVAEIKAAMASGGDTVAAAKKALLLFCGERRLTAVQDMVLISIFGDPKGGLLEAVAHPPPGVEHQPPGIRLPGPVNLTVTVAVCQLYVAYFNPPQRDDYPHYLVDSQLFAFGVGGDGEITGFEKPDGNVDEMREVVLSLDWNELAKRDNAGLPYCARAAVSYLCGHVGEDAEVSALAVPVYECLNIPLRAAAARAAAGTHLKEAALETLEELTRAASESLRTTGRSYQHPTLGELSGGDLHIDLMTWMYQLPRDIFEQVRHRDTLPQGWRLGLSIAACTAVCVAATVLRVSYFTPGRRA